MAKTETIETVTKGDINDLKAYANEIGVKCENCKHSTGGKLSSITWCERLEIEILINEPDSFFCHNFVKKETNEQFN